MRRSIGAITAVLLVALLVIGGAQWRLLAQARRAPGGRGTSPPPLPPPTSEPAPERASKIPLGEPAVSVQDALLRVYDLPFAEPTTLEEVVQHLRRTLNAPVVLDQAALERQELSADDTVQLKLEGVRLKTALKLLLGQVRLTYYVVPEDNLLVLTDARESDDRYVRILDEIKSLHRDIHDLQDAVDELRDAEEPDSQASRILPIATRRR